MTRSQTRTPRELVYGVWRGRREPGARSRSLTISWSRFDWFGPIIEAADVDALLRRALGAGFRWCLVQRSGHVIHEQWQPDHRGQKGFLGLVEDLCADPELFVAGKLVDAGDSAAGLDPSCFLVNLDLYRRLGSAPVSSAADGCSAGRAAAGSRW